MKLHHTTSRFKRQFRREVSGAIKQLRENERNHSPELVRKLVKNALRQRSGHYMKKSIRGIYEQIPQEFRA